MNVFLNKVIRYLMVKLPGEYSRYLKLNGSIFKFVLPMKVDFNANYTSIYEAICKAISRTAH